MPSMLGENFHRGVQDLSTAIQKRKETKGQRPFKQQILSKAGFQGLTEADLDSIPMDALLKVATPLLEQPSPQDQFYQMAVDKMKGGSGGSDLPSELPQISATLDEESLPDVAPETAAGSLGPVPELSSNSIGAIPELVLDRIGPFKFSETPDQVAAKAALKREERIKDIKAESAARAETHKSRPLSPEASSAVASAESAIDAIDSLLAIEAANPGTMKVAMFPATPPFGSKETQTADKALKKLKLEASKITGGKAITEIEKKLIKEGDLPSILARSDVNVDTLNTLRNTFSDVRNRIMRDQEGVVEKKQPKAANPSTKATSIFNRLSSKLGVK